MKIGRRAEEKIRTNPDKRNSFRSMSLIILIIVTAVLIFWVYAMGRKAEDTVSVCMWNEPVYKNEPISESMLVEYKMIKAEFEKYATDTGNGTKQRRIVLWDEKDDVIGYFAAYPIQEETVVFMNDLVSSRVDNSDSVLYTFPGKDIVALDVGEEGLEAFKTFLQPGDRVNITCTYTTEEQSEYMDESGDIHTDNVTNFRQERLFTDVLLADLLNDNGESVLDKYQQYKNMSTWDQANLDDSEEWKTETQPSKVLLALTPDELERYFEYKAKEGVNFVMTLPQRTE